jgi:CheY-like chemotaxis protein
MVIAGCGDLLSEHVPEGRPAKALLQEIQRAGGRAKLLARVLSHVLTREKPRLEPFDLAAFAADLRGLLVPFLGDRIDLFTSVAEGAGRPKADAGIIACALVRIAAHASRALEDGGRFNLRAADVPAPAGGRPEKVELAVQVGCVAGERPTTPPGGFAALVDLVARGGGALAFEPDPSFGATYRFTLPRSADATPAAAPPGAGAGAATVLLVDDEAAIRKICAANLQSMGCRVIACASGREALEAAAARPGGIDILMTDVVMPEMGGPALARKLLEKDPGTFVIFMSGYADEAELREAVRGGAFEFLQKPFTRAVVTEMVQRVLADLAARRTKSA